MGPIWVNQGMESGCRDMVWYPDDSSGLTAAAFALHSEKHGVN